MISKMYNFRQFKTLKVDKTVNERNMPGMFHPKK